MRFNTMKKSKMALAVVITFVMLVVSFGIVFSKGSAFAADVPAPSAINPSSGARWSYNYVGFNQWEDQYNYSNNEIMTHIARELESVNSKIRNIVVATNSEVAADRKAALDAAVEEGTIPFYKDLSKNENGYVGWDILRDFGKTSEILYRARSLEASGVMYNLASGTGISYSEAGLGGWESGITGDVAIVSFNPKIGEVIFVSGAFAKARWNSTNVNLNNPVSNAFKVGDAWYQNFERGYIKVEGSILSNKSSTVTVVSEFADGNFKNVDKEGVEHAVSANAAGSLGMIVTETNEANAKEIAPITSSNYDIAVSMALSMSTYYEKLFYNEANPQNLGYVNYIQRSDDPMNGAKQSRGAFQFSEIVPIYVMKFHTNNDTANKNLMISYNIIKNETFTIKDKIADAFEGNKSKPDFYIGSPMGEQFTVTSGANSGKTYQNFEKGYFTVDGDNVTKTRGRNVGADGVELPLEETPICHLADLFAGVEAANFEVETKDKTDEHVIEFTKLYRRIRFIYKETNMDEIEAKILACDLALWHFNQIDRVAQAPILIANQPATNLVLSHSFATSPSYTINASGGSGDNSFVYSIVEGGTGEGTINNNVLAITKCGSFIIMVSKEGREPSGNDSGLRDARVTFTLNVQRANGSMPSAMPELEKVTGTSIVYKDVEGYDYRINDGVWQKSGTFENLEPNTEYTVYVRRAFTNTENASDYISATIKTTADVAADTTLIIVFSILVGLAFLFAIFWYFVKGFVLK